MKNIIQKYKNNIKSIIKRFTGTSNEDIEQEVYFKTWKNLPKYKEQGNFTQWISTITANTCKDYLKREKNNKENNEFNEEKANNIIAQKSNVEEIFELKIKRKRIAEAILQLPSKQQEVIILYEIEGMDYQEISYKLKCPLGTVKSRIFKARQELYKLLSDLL
ncbi:sigma-70 family RNA polymerase sigma factor [bacterium]|nr:sigma-70 family RNA polymerase sigma factor [bacterium]